MTFSKGDRVVEIKGTGQFGSVVEVLPTYIDRQGKPREHAVPLLSVALDSGVTRLGRADRFRRVTE